MAITLIILFPLIGFLINGLFGRYIPKDWHGRIATLAVGASFVCVVTVWLTLVRLSPEDRILSVHWWDWITVGDLNVPFKFIVDPLSCVMLLIITGIGSLIHLYSCGYMHEDPSTHRFFAYLNLFVFSMLILVLGSSLLTLFIGWEGVGLCSYLLIGFWFEDDKNASAGKKAFITNRIGDLGMLLGIFTLFMLTGSLEFSVINETISTGALNSWITLACLFLFMGATGKSAQLPLYVWLPDAMAGPTPVSALIHAATMVTAGVFMIARLNGLFIMSPIALHVILWVGAATALFAATIGLVQNDIKKVLAYSTVSQLGFMFVAMGTGNFAVGVFHLMTHAFFKACLFLGSGSVIHANHHEQDMRHYGGLRKFMPITFITYLVSTFAIAGLPPFSGFFSKDEILWNAFGSHFNQGNLVPWVMVLIAAIFTAIYMARSVVMTFYGEFRGDHHVKEHLHESPSTMTIPLIILGSLATLGGFLSYPSAWVGSDFFPNILHEWLEPSLKWGTEIFNAANEHGTLHEAHGTETLLVFVSITIAVVGLAIGFIANKEGGFAEKLSAKFKAIHKVLYNKYYVDEFYGMILIKPLWLFSKNFLHRVVDVLMIDGLVNSFGFFTRLFSNILSRLQSGNAHWYAFYVVCGLGAFLYVMVVI